MDILSKSDEKTIEYGYSLGKLLSGGTLIAMYGDLGGGKTQFSKGIAGGLEVQDEIISPTFVFRRDYEGCKLRLVHYDFYRIEKPDEDMVEGLREEMNSQDTVTIIEWAERVRSELPKDRIDLHFYYESENHRMIQVDFMGKYKSLEGPYRYEVIKCER